MNQLKSFLEAHLDQLEALNIPSTLFEQLQRHLEACFFVHRSADVDAPRRLLINEFVDHSSEFGAIVVMPHLCSWDITNHKGMLESLQEVSDQDLVAVWNGLRESWGELTVLDVPKERLTLLEDICDPRTWARVILYVETSSSTVRAALPAPPYYPQFDPTTDENLQGTEADLSGPFAFRYHADFQTVIDVSLAYLSPGIFVSKLILPTIDLVPSYMCPNPLTRSVRYVALLMGQNPPPTCLAQVKEHYAHFVHQMHLVRQQKEELRRIPIAKDVEPNEPIDLDRVWKVYTDANDPMELGHADAGLTDPHFTLTGSLEDADIVYSFRSVFAPGPLKDLLEERARNGSPVRINQFPYEGALVQKDHLGREILRQFGLPLPPWAIETYDLDVQLAEFVGAVALEVECETAPVWIVKPARGTQSKGHLVTRSTGHILRLLDAGGESRVVQRYIEQPICYDGRKVDCRVYVLMTNASPGRPSLYMHNRVFFRIAHKAHEIDGPINLMDYESVLTASHLLDEATRSSQSPLRTLPVDWKTIAKLEHDYEGFEWESTILPKIQTMIRDLFSSMTLAFPAMSTSRSSRALYGLDIMYDQCEDTIEPKLTEVTFCPANNAICDAYERDEELFRSFNNDIFNCLFRGVISNNIKEL